MPDVTQERAPAEQQSSESALIEALATEKGNTDSAGGEGEEADKTPCPICGERRGDETPCPHCGMD